MRTLGRYSLGEELGRGGTGVVFRGHDPMLDRQVAVKLLASGRGPRSRERLRREARVVARMDHPGIVPVFDLGDASGEIYLVMPLLEGRTLRDLLDEGRPPVEMILDIGRQIALALEYAHERGIVHRDVKPENIMLGEEREGTRAKVMDFGIAQAGDVRESAEHAVVGTPAYLSPEQAKAERVDQRADVYGLGAVLYECLAGRPPFGDLPLVPMLTAVVFDVPTRLQELEPQLPDWLDSLVMRCLEKDPKRRPQTAREVHEALGGAESVSAPSIAPPRASRLRGREDVLRVLERRLRSAAEGPAQLVLVGGEPGIGKSALVDELHGIARARGARVLVGRCFDREDKVPYHGLCDAFAGFLDEVGDEVTPALSALLPELALVFPSLGAKLGEMHATLDATLLATHHDATRVVELIARALLAIADDRPLVLTLEDMQGGDISIDALHYLHRRLADEPVLLVATYQSLSVAPPLRRMMSLLRRDPRVLSLELGPLPPAAQRGLLDEVLGAPVTEQLAAHLYTLSGGHPYYLQLLAQEMMDVGSLELVDGRWHGRGDEPLPDSLRELVGARIARLDEETRDVLGAAAVIGNFFSADDLAVLVDGTVALDAAIELGLVRRARRPSGAGFTFANDLSRLVLYETVPEDRRRALHARIARALERALGPGDNAHASVLAHHYRRAGIAADGLRHAVIAAQQALEALSPEEALRLLDVVPSLGAGEVSDVELVLAGWSLRVEAHRQSRDDDAASADLRPAIALARSVDALGRAAELLATAAELAVERGDSEGAMGFVQEALVLEAIEAPTRERLHRIADGIATRVPTTPSGMQTLAREDCAPPDVTGQLLLMQGEYLAAVDAYDHAIESLGEGERLDATVEARLLLRRARLARSLGRYAECDEQCLRARAVLGDAELVLQAEVFACKSLGSSAAGDFEEAHHAARAGLGLVAMSFDADRAERERVLALLQRSVGNMLLGRGRAEEAIESFRHGLALCETGADLWERSVARFNVGEALVSAGRLDEGVSYLEHAMEEKLEIGDHWGLAYVHHALAEVALARGDHEGATRHAERGHAYARESGDPKPVVMHRVLRGTLERLGGDDEAAHDTLRLALREAERYGARPEIMAAHIELSALALDRADVEQALTRAGVARAYAFDGGSSLDCAMALCAIGRALTRGERFEEAATALAEARGFAVAYGNAYRVRAVDDAIAELGVARSRSDP